MDWFTNLFSDNPSYQTGDLFQGGETPNMDSQFSDNFGDLFSSTFSSFPMLNGPENSNYTFALPEITQGQAPQAESLFPSMSNAPATASSFMDVLSEIGKQGKDKVGSMIDSNPRALLGLGGAAANLAGNVLNQNAMRDSQRDYIQSATWTPQKTENYMNALRSNVTSLYGNQAQGKNKAMAASDAVRGRGGGSYGAQNEAIGREMRSNIAQALNQGALTTNTPINLGMGAYMNTSPIGDTLKGLGGDLASIMNSRNQMDYLKKLGIIK